ncbi:ATP-binding protein [Chryseotalea sanaruensis]|uniref:histidine kinase n=1 Tax=Chryseotalea sanaruensis TaxID=2482724 RepID=A0A401U5F3_9BACT|nr:ATP-binding protein [Chryseotalea sanaruensis]
MAFALTDFTHAFAQSISKDSLKSALDTKLSDKQRVDILNALAYKYYDFNDSIALKYAEEALQLSLNIEHPSGLQYAYTLCGVGYFTFGEYQRALDAFSKSDSLSKKGLREYTLYNLMLMGRILADIGELYAADSIFQRGFAMLEESKGGSYAAGIYKGYAHLKMYQWQNEEALRSIQKAEKLRSNESEGEKIDLYLIYAKVYVNLGDIEQATINVNKLCELINNQEDQFHTGMCYYLNALIHFKQNKFQLALSESFKVLELTKVYDYHLLRVQVYTLIGEIYGQLSDYKLASDFIYKALSITEKDGLKPMTAALYNDLAWIYKDQSNFQLALEYTDRAQLIHEAMSDQRGVASCHNVRGLIFLLQNKIKESIEEHSKALVIRQRINHPTGIAASLYNMGLSYETLGMLDKALELQLEALAIDKTIGDKLSLGISYNGLAALYLKLGKLADAEKALAQVNILANETGSRLLLKNFYTNYADYSDAKGDHKTASIFRKKQQVLSDSLYSESNSMKLAEMQALYQVERKEQEIELLSKERALQVNALALQEARLRNQTFIISVGVVAILFAAGFIFFIVRTNKKLIKAKVDLAELNEELMAQSEELRESNESLVELNNKLLEQREEIQAQSEELRESNDALLKLNEALHEKQEEVLTQAEELREANETISNINVTLEQKVEERTHQLKQAYVELDTFFYRSSHDFRRPITTFMGLAEVAGITVKDTKAIELFDKVRETAESLDKMIRKLQSISDVGAQELVLKEVLLKEMIDNILIGFQEELARKNIKVHKQFSNIRSFDSYPALINVILGNIVENAIHFASPVNPFVKILVEDYTDKLVISIQDNGQGIPEDYHGRIFDMYFRASVSSKGNGLGLYIVKKAVEKLNANISFITRNNDGTTFSVELPILH